MKNYSGFEWLLIDAANHFGHDKELFETRIKWAMDYLDCLQNMTNEADNKPLFQKAVMAIRKAQRGEATGHMVGVDACCSGIQVMSAMTGCIAGATATGMVDPNVRADAYMAVTNEMNRILKTQHSVPREFAKKATMTAFYGSKLTPKHIFGEDTPELNAFYEAMYIVAPGAWELLQDLLGAWRPYELAHAWKLPDGFDAVVKVMERREARIEVDELGHASFTYEFYENRGTRSGISLPANVTHSMDGYVAREMHRRCNYSDDVVASAQRTLVKEQLNRTKGGKRDYFGTHSITYYVEQYERSSLVSTVILPHINQHTVAALSDEHIKKLIRICEQILGHKPFPLVTVHDEFKAHANNINQVRWHYKEILAEIADSEVLSDIMSQITGTPGKYHKLSTNLGVLIRGSNYALT